MKYEKHPERSFTQKRQILKELRNTTLASLARDGVDTVTAFRVLQDIQLELLEDYGDFKNCIEVMEYYPRHKKEYDETYDAVVSALSHGSSRGYVDFGTAYLALQNLVLDLLHDDLGESTNVD